ncbi:hypothetical protein [Paenibacillus macerans]|uniref:Uncharacterized protein n=2 Tax=Paenibacillus macerans TaxID=44252 RepID=A0A090ZBN1_PAEMA|nr:hypothetical protein [Paenibacillus macerans]KFN08032.1 hypothetical protein DJ90_3313 [Paenibacillus macerans]MCY7560051.1 hypothetical protein [Paenibacillus macerans]MEC0151949.1 hypothetical protein [Paenibacillus macerans]SUA84904.1 Uncharacterised protein [Paenibacillus macerans]
MDMDMDMDMDMAMETTRKSPLKIAVWQREIALSSTGAANRRLDSENSRTLCTYYSDMIMPIPISGIFVLIFL